MIVLVLKSNLITDNFHIENVGASVFYKNKQYHWLAMAKDGGIGIIRIR